MTDLEVLFTCPVKMCEVDGILTLCQPVVLIHDTEIKFGIELPPGNKYFVWGMFYPQSLIRMWRAMMLLDQLPSIQRNCLSTVYEITEYPLRRRPSSDWKKMFNMFEPKKLKAIRKKILSLTPPENDFARALGIVTEHNIPIEFSELAFLEQPIKIIADDKT